MCGTGSSITRNQGKLNYVSYNYISVLTKYADIYLFDVFFGILSTKASLDSR